MQNIHISLNYIDHGYCDLNIFLLQHKAIGIGHKFNNLDRPLPYTNTLYIEI